MNREFRLVCGLLTVLIIAACSDKGSVVLGCCQTATTDTADFGIAYIKRVLPTDPGDLAVMRGKDDLRHNRHYWSKADVYMRSQAEESGKEINITARITGTDYYDVKDLDVSPDGKFLVFAMRGPLVKGQQDFEPPTWRIWEYDIAKDNLFSITDDITASEGQDISPHFLPSDSAHPNGQILIASTRQRASKLVLLTEGKSAFEAQSEDLLESAFTLTVLDPTQTGPSAFQQISFNASHDMNPTVLSTGQILYTHWAHKRLVANNGWNLYTVNPDGTNDQLLFGAHSHFVGTVDPATGLPSQVHYVKAREMENHNIMAVIRDADSGTDFGGQLVILDTADYVECTQRTLAAAPVVPNTNTCPPLTPATFNNVSTVPGPSPGGRFNSAYPLWDGTGRILVSWTECRLLNAAATIVPCSDANLAAPNPQISAPLYSAWLLNPGNNTFKPVVPPTEGIMLTDIVSLQARNPPLYIPPIGTSTLSANDVGIIDIRSVYDWADAINPQAVGAETNAQTIARITKTPADSRRVRFLRLEKIVSLGDPRLKDGFPNYDKAIALDNSPRYMREILGYVPIEADGSVRVQVPANVAFNLSVLDARAHRLDGFPEHLTWLQLRPGEVMQCNGCHNASNGAASTTSHGRSGLFKTQNPGDATGRTKAQVKYGANTDCTITPCNAAVPTVDVIYQGTGAPGDTSIDLSYNKMTTPAPTVPQTCTNFWEAVCRITINYAPSAMGAANTSPAIIDPLWTVARGAHTCVNCHTATNTQTVPCTPAGTSTPINVTINLPAAGGLELDADPNQTAATQLRAYVQLVATHTTSTFSLDPTCVPVRVDSQVPGSITNGSAAASPFFKVLTGNSVGTVDHATYMSPSELRLVAEWADVGAQYYNNPFAAPLQ
jgi:Hydrazine synthase alpha subunit middle domain